MAFSHSVDMGSVVCYLSWLVTCGDHLWSSILHSGDRDSSEESYFKAFSCKNYFHFPFVMCSVQRFLGVDANAQQIKLILLNPVEQIWKTIDNSYAFLYLLSFIFYTLQNDV